MNALSLNDLNAVTGGDDEYGGGADYGAADYGSGDSGASGDSGGGEYGASDYGASDYGNSGDGSNDASGNDASTQRFDDGSELTTNPDGTTSATEAPADPQSTTQRFDDGSELRTDPDGTTSATNAPQSYFDGSGRLANFEQQGWKVSDYGRNGLIQVKNPDTGAVIHGRMQNGEWRPVFSWAAVIETTRGRAGR